MKLPYRCSALIDQGRYIGEDPVGHACYHKAIKELNGELICSTCETWLNSSKGRRVTFLGNGKYIQDWNAARYGYIEMVFMPDEDIR